LPRGTLGEAGTILGPHRGVSLLGPHSTELPQVSQLPNPLERNDERPVQPLPEGLSA
jgi:hypothetical protein